MLKVNQNNLEIAKILKKKMLRIKVQKKTERMKEIIQIAKIPKKMN